MVHEDYLEVLEALVDEERRAQLDITILSVLLPFLGVRTLEANGRFEIRIQCKTRRVSCSLLHFCVMYG
jgi:hypothetical protein